MATAEQIGIRREAAMGRLTAATKKLSKHLGVEFDDFPESDRDPLMLDARRVEWTAAALASVESRAERLSDAKAIEAELAAVTEEREAALEAAAAAKEADAQDAAIRDAMQRLVGLAADDDVVRFALTKAGFIQAKESDGGVSVSVVGLGPDLFAEPGRAEPVAPPPANIDLDAMKRDELDAHAASLGIAEPEKLPNKAAVIDAIRALPAGETD